MQYRGCKKELTTYKIDIKIIDIKFKITILNEIWSNFPNKLVLIRNERC